MTNDSMPQRPPLTVLSEDEVAFRDAVADFTNGGAPVSGTRGSAPEPAE